MKVYEQKWWQRLFRKEHHEPKEDALRDIDAVREFLKGVKDDVRQLQPLLAKLEELERERQVASASILPVNLQAQAEIMDKLLQHYEFFQNDGDINGIRVKRMGQALLQHARKAGLDDLVHEKKKDMKWTFDW